MNSTTLVGNITGDPVLRGTADKPRATFTVAVNEGERGTDSERTHFIDVTAFGTLGENTATSLRKGQRVIVHGRFNSYKTAVTINGDDKEIGRLSITASAVGPDLRWATAETQRVALKNGNGTGHTNGTGPDGNWSNGSGSNGGRTGGGNGGRNGGWSNGGQAGGWGNAPSGVGSAPSCGGADDDF